MNSKGSAPPSAKGTIRDLLGENQDEQTGQQQQASAKHNVLTSDQDTESLGE